MSEKFKVLWLDQDIEVDRDTFEIIKLMVSERNLHVPDTMTLGIAGIIDEVEEYLHDRTLAKHLVLAARRDLRKEAGLQTY